MSSIDLGCNHQTFFDYPELTQADLCQIAISQQCAINYTFANFYKFTYCDLGGSWGGFIPLAIFFLYLIFRFIGAVVEGYLAPAIAYTTEWLKLSEAMGAVTLLALANGAGDVVTAIVASTSPGGVSYNIGSLYGAGLFVTTVVVAFTIMGAGEAGVQLGPDSIYRDVGLYIFSTLIIIGFGAAGNLSIAAGFILLSLYIFYVLGVYLQENCFQKQKETPSSDESKQQQEELLLATMTNNPQNTESNKPKNTLAINKFKKAVHKVQIGVMTCKIYHLALHKLENLRQKKEQEPSFDEMNVFEKICFIADYPFVFIKKITIPPAEEKEYNKYWAAISITPGLILIFWILVRWQMYELYAIFPIGVILSLIVLITSPWDEVPKYYILLQTYGIICSLFWTYLASGIMIDMLNFVGMLTNLSQGYLGLTIIAMGNALPDALTTIALSKQGLAIMGMTGAFAGQLFGLLVGLGLALIKLNTDQSVLEQYLYDGKVKNFRLFTKAYLIEAIVIFTILGTLTFTFIYGIKQKFKFDKLLAYVLISSYVIMFIIVTSIAIVQAVN